MNDTATFSHHIMAPDRTCLNNLILPVLYYKHVINLQHNMEQAVQDLLASNEWSNSWVNGIFTYHHNHSNVYEVLVILSGHGMLELGGDDGKTSKQFQQEK